MSTYKQSDKLPAGYQDPVALPSDSASLEWQARNRSWWQNNPMRYDWNEKINLQPFTAEFYQEIDRRFFEDSRRYMPWVSHPFERILSLNDLAKCDVLEIGVGNGSHAQLIAPHCRSYHGIDITEFAVNSTSERLKIFGIDGCIEEMDAEAMRFPDASFDFVWSWGVIHHSSNTRKILEEINRVLRPGGTATIMVYHRSFLYTYITTALIRGVLLGGLLKHNLHELIQLNTDGAIARFYTKKEWQTLANVTGFSVNKLFVMGQKSEILPLPAGTAKNLLMSKVPNKASRFITNTLQQGSFLVSMLTRNSATSSV